MQRIVPHLWFDKEAVEASKFYVSVFGGKVKNISQIHDTPSGDCDIVSFDLLGLSFMSISAGPYFKFNPSISFIVNFDAEEKLNAAWKKLSQGGKVLMELQEYPWSKHYGWIQDKYGLSWQLILNELQGNKEEKVDIVPSLLFVGKNYGNAEKAVKYYLSVFKDSKLGGIMHYGSGQEPNKEGTVMFSDFKINGIWIAAMDGGGEHPHQFNEAISFIVNCKDQKEIDYYWEKLSHDPKSEQCGWCKDKFGVSWQVTPDEMEKFMAGPPEKVARVTEAFLKMKKFDIKKLRESYEGR